ncbi:hypothetical protein ACWPM1_02580 [Tsuneonella sp. HG249]
MQNQHEDRIELAIERYWLEGMELGNARQRAIIEHSRQEALLQGRLREAAREPDHHG